MGIISKLGNAAKNRKQKKTKDVNKDMSFLDHLEELRWHLMRSFAAIVIIAIAIFVNVQAFLDKIVLAPTQASFPTNRLLCAIRESLCFDTLNVEYIAFTPYEQFLKSITISLVAGLIFAFPYFLWEIWRFVKPGLHNHEKKGLKGNVFIMSLLFFTGVAFAYYVILPFSFQFFSSYQISEAIENKWKIGSVISLVTQVAFGGGLLFEMPILVYYLSKMGIITPQGMRQYRRHAIVVMLILAAIITPPDWVTQVLIFIPLAGLYQLSIFISASVHRRMAKEEAEERKQEVAKAASEPTEPAS
ncbi:twin-arginine translocase subunit TatC [Pontibacter sp. G13]|uniref:twin-arginine translocase subunit TatC n=1 Tax=Pontibacter sp. G13 TaxID=3074898 RepID=UPI00288A8DCB|nr:twin-arginine translocase subunit TatC [Pontibacter sp. G13]WNJ16930.1 twin-arginine translocase subunit TatC [Pontibacter sp. G13]